MEKINCPICDSGEFKLVVSGGDTLHGVEGKFDVLKCIHCSLMLTNPRPDSYEIGKYYPNDYNPYKLNFKRAKLMANLQKKYGWFFRIINPNMTIDLNADWKKADILEIGCGAGNFLYELRYMHPEWDIKGADFSEKSIKRLNDLGMNTFVSDLTKIPLESGSVDTVYGWMIVEHIHRINESLLEVHRVLKNDGAFVFSIPNAGSWEFEFFSQNWFALQLPSHLYHFTDSTIAKILEKNGFEIEKIFYQRNLANIFSSFKIIIEKSSLPKKIKYLLKKFISWNLVYFFLTLPIASIIAMFKQSGRLTIIAKKTHDFQ